MKGSIGAEQIWRRVELALASLVSIVAAPVVLICAAAVWVVERKNPIYAARRIGLEGAPFTMFKLRTMRGGELSGVDSTAADDPRLTRVGRLLRGLKVDELPQLLNVLAGQMRLVGPRPQVEREVAIYTPQERRLLTVQPGITDLASIVFSDLQDLLAGSKDPDLDYNQLVRPWKSRLGLLYVDRRSPGLDLETIWLTAVNVFARERALGRLQALVRELGADDELVRVCGRRDPLVKAPPPGASTIVTSRSGPPL